MQEKPPEMQFKIAFRGAIYLHWIKYQIMAMKADKSLASLIIDTQ